MNIGFDGKRAAQNRTGLGNYSRFVVRILSEQMPEDNYHLYVPNPRKTPYLKEIPTLDRLHLHFARGLWRLCRSAWRSLGICQDLRRDHIDIYHGLSNELPLNIRQAGCLSVVTIHDLIFLRCPQYYHWIDRKIYDYKFRRACQDADRVIAVSEFTKRDIMDFYHIPEQKIDVVYQGCDKAFARPVSEQRLDGVRQKYDLPPRYVLYVGSIEERKNVGLLIQALQICKEQGRPFHLVMVGRSTAYCERQKACVAQLGLEDFCHFFHQVPFDDLPPLYRLAAAFVYPSRIEGFGIPLLEAITSGTPAIGCTGSCLEEAGGPGSIYVDPDNAEAMAQVVSRVLTDEDLRRRMIADGKEYARGFTDERLSEALMEVYKKL